MPDRAIKHNFVHRSDAVHELRYLTLDGARSLLADRRHDIDLVALPEAAGDELLEIVGWRLMTCQESRPPVTGSTLLPPLRPRVLNDLRFVVAGGVIIVR